MSRSIKKIGNLSIGRKSTGPTASSENMMADDNKSTVDQKGQSTGGLQSLLKNIESLIPGKDLSRFLSLSDNDLSNIALHTAYVEKVHKKLVKEATAAVPNFKDDPQHKFLRQLVADHAKLLAEVQYVREELNGVPLSHTRQKAVDPVAFMGELERKKGTEGPKLYQVDLNHGFVGGGWYAAEGSNDHYWRWSGPTNSSTVLLPSLGGGKLRFDLKVKPINPDPAYAKALRVYVNGVEAPVGEIIPEDSTVLSFVMDVGPADPYEKLVLRLELPRSYSPNELNGAQDYRKLGLALFNCAVSIEEDGEI